MTTGTPVIFIHGLWLHASSWQPWVDLFAAEGYQPLAPGWPGDPDTVEAARANPEAVADHGIDDVTDHYAKIIDSGWREVAGGRLSWLAGKGLGPQ